MLAPLVACLALWVRHRAEAPRVLGRFVCERLPDMVGELVLFLGAGVLAAGLVALSDSLGGWAPFALLDAGAASIVLLVTLVLAVVGIHPVIVVSTAAPILMPVAPDPNLAAMLFVMGWGIGCAACPLSGTNLVVHGRYRVSNWRLARSNLAFCSLMTLLAIGFLHLYEWARILL